MSQKKQSPKTSGIGSFISRFILKTLFFGLGLAVCGLIFGTLSRQFRLAKLTQSDRDDRLSPTRSFTYFHC
ncbi:hypothetical protein OURE66S_04280 [Oligella ureolytica]